MCFYQEVRPSWTRAHNPKVIGSNPIPATIKALVMM